MRHGARVDNVVNKVSLGKVRLNPATPGHREAGRYFAALREKGLVLKSVQTCVADATLGLSSRTDGLYTDAEGKIWVIELKTTLKTHQEHAATYHVACLRLPTLACGLSNTQHWRHQLQVGFAAMTLRAQGMVVVVCSNGYKTYPLRPDATRRTHFAIPFTPTPRTRHPPAAIKLLPWPDNDAALRAVLGARRPGRRIVAGCAVFPGLCVAGVVTSRPAAPRRTAQLARIARQAAKHKLPPVALVRIKKGWAKLQAP